MMQFVFPIVVASTVGNVVLTIVDLACLADGPTPASTGGTRCRSYTPAKYVPYLLPERPIMGPVQTSAWEHAVQNRTRGRTMFEPRVEICSIFGH